MPEGRDPIGHPTPVQGNGLGRAVDFDWTVYGPVLRHHAGPKLTMDSGPCDVDPSLRRHDPAQVQGSSHRRLSRFAAISQPRWWATRLGQFVKAPVDRTSRR